MAFSILVARLLSFNVGGAVDALTRRKQLMTMSGRTKCSGSEMRPITGRVTIFGTVCPAPPTKRSRIDTAPAPVPAPATSPTIHTPA
eukprot:scaffold9198_cov103-Alexandrium_tamarense.AAC.1